MPASRRSKSAGEERSSSMKWMRPSCRYCRLLDRRTAAHVSMPCFNASSTMKLPMKPEAPVMRIFILSFLGQRYDKKTRRGEKRAKFAKNKGIRCLDVCPEKSVQSYLLTFHGNSYFAPFISIYTTIELPFTRLIFTYPCIASPGYIVVFRKYPSCFIARS